MKSIIDIAGLSYAYPGGAVALRGINLRVETGSVVGVIGPNGGGKTTLIKLLTGQLGPSAGTVSIDGLSPAKAVARGDLIGYLPQNSARPEAFPLNVRQVVRLGLAGKTGIARSYHPQDLAFVDELLIKVGMADFAMRPIGQLSGGQIQRVFIARALAPRPRVLLMDEPTTGVDRQNQQRFIELILSLKTDLGLTVVMVSHDLRAVTALCDRIACLNSTLHYHDVPQKLPAELVYRMFACDLQAMGLADHKGCGDPVCGHTAAAAVV